MELKELVQVFKRHLGTVLVFAGLFALAGAAFYFYFPKSYKAIGSFYISRAVSDETSQGDFTYEGYYAQQTATNYTGTFIGLLESVDVRKAALEDLGQPVNAQTLRKSARNINVKKAAPQLVVLTVKAPTPELAESFWTSLSDSATGASAALNNFAGDPGISVLQISSAPVVQETFNNLFVDIFVGLSFGLLLGTFVSAFKEYLS